MCYYSHLLIGESSSESIHFYLFLFTYHETENLLILFIKGLYHGTIGQRRDA